MLTMNTIAISSEDHTALLETISDVMLTKAEAWYVLRMINEDKATDKTPAVLLKNSATYISGFSALFMIYSTKAYHLVYYLRSGNYPISVQSQRKFLIVKSPTIDQSHCYHWYCI